MKRWQVYDELQKIWKDAVVAYLKVQYCTIICLEAEENHEKPRSA
jgi:hypothetical protein